MASQAHRRQVLLFLVAVLLPCSVLVALGVRIVAQERELSEKRLEDEQLRVVNQVHSDLLARLERIKLQEATALAAPEIPSDTSERAGIHVALVASLRDGRLVPPWEEDNRSEVARRRLEEAEYARSIRQGERQELRHEAVLDPRTVGPHPGFAPAREFKTGAIGRVAVRRRGRGFQAL